MASVQRICRHALKYSFKGKAATCNASISDRNSNLSLLGDDTFRKSALQVRCLSTSDICYEPQQTPASLNIADDEKSDTDYTSHDQPDITNHRAISKGLRTETTDPAQHTVLDLSKFYTVNQDAVKSLDMQKLLRKEFSARANAFQETGFMVRQPALEARDYIFNLTKPDSIAAKVLLYGADGCGKSITFAQVLQAAQSQNWFIICPVRQYLWNSFYREVAVSTHKADRVDLPEEGAEFLLSIKNMNRSVFSKYGDQLRLRGTYSWSRREVSNADSLLEELVTLGIERPKYSCDVIGALLKEVRLHSADWPMKTLLALDGVNSLYNMTNIIANKEKREKLHPHRISLIYNLNKLISSNWKNGAMLLTADIKSSHYTQRESHQPRYLLTEAGFDAVNPFIPVEVHNFTDQEINVYMDYLTEMKWTPSSEGLRRELKFLSNKNPQYLDEVCRSL